MAGSLPPPLSQAALGQGFHNLGAAADVLGGYQGSIAGARRDWAQRNADVVVSFIRGYRAGLAWLSAPASKAAAIAILQTEVPEITAAAAEQTYALMVADSHGFDSGGKIDLAGARQVLDLRRRYGPQGKAVADVGRFLDQSYFERAAR